LGGRTTAGGGSNGKESVSGSAQGSFPPLTKQDFLKIDRAIRDQDARKVAEFRAPKASETRNEFSKTASSRAIAAGKIDDSTVRQIILAIKHGSPWERAQAVAYLRRIEATNPEIVTQLQKTHPDVVFQAAARWARIEHYGLGKVADRVDPARLILVLDGLDRYGSLSRSERAILKSEIQNLRRRFSPVGRYLEEIRIDVARQPNGPTRTFITDQHLVERLNESGMLGAIATSVGATASVGGLFATGAAAMALSLIGGAATFLGVSDLVRQQTAEALKQRRDASRMTDRSFYLHVLRQRQKKTDKIRPRTERGPLKPRSR